MIDYDGSVSLKNRRYLPPKPGIYFVVQDNDNQVIYVGQSKNIQNRWKIHHRLREFKTYPSFLKIYWIVMPVDKLTELERHYINKLHPSMNRKSANKPMSHNRKGRVKSFPVRLTKTEYAELSRLADEAGLTVAGYVRERIFRDAQ